MPRARETLMPPHRKLTKFVPVSGGNLLTFTGGLTTSQVLLPYLAVNGSCYVDCAIWRNGMERLIFGTCNVSKETMHCATIVNTFRNLDLSGAEGLQEANAAERDPMAVAFEKSTRGHARGLKRVRTRTSTRKSTGGRGCKAMVGGRRQKWR